MAGMLVLAFAFLVYTSSMKNVGLFMWDYDTQCWYTGGTCWWNGDSPHDKDKYTETWTELFGRPPNNQATFVYPPTMAIISVPIALLPWPAAAWIFRGVSLLAFLGIVYLTRQLMMSFLPRLRLLGPTGVYVCLTATLGSVTQCLNQGQCTLIVVCGCLAAWYGFQRKILWIFLLGFLVACIKPQVSMIPLLYIFFLGGYRWFFYGAGLAGVFSLIVLVAVPPTDLLASYQGSIEDHMQHQYFNQWDWYCGVPALLGATSVAKPVAILGILLGIAGAGWIAWRQRQFADTLRNRLRHQQLIWIVTMAAMPIHIYDLIGQVFVVITLWALPDWRRRVIVVVTMYLADKAYVIADRVERIGGPVSEWHDIVKIQGTSIAALVLLGLFFYWYWRDYRTATTR